MFTGDGYTVSDIRCSGQTCNNNSVEDVLYSQNNKFASAFDVNGDGLGDNRDLFALGTHLVSGGASQTVLDSYVGLLLKRGDFNASGTTDTERRLHDDHRSISLGARRFRPRRPGGRP
jgi:hypothetical protein